MEANALVVCTITGNWKTLYAMNCIYIMGIWHDRTSAYPKLAFARSWQTAKMEGHPSQCLSGHYEKTSFFTNK